MIQTRDRLNSEKDLNQNAIRDIEIDMKDPEFQVLPDRKRELIKEEATLRSALSSVLDERLILERE